MARVESIPNNEWAIRRAVYQDILKIHARVLATLGIETHRPRGVNLFSPTIFP